MNRTNALANPHRPATWALVLAFAAIYISWGTTYLAIKDGVKTLPPFLFSGPRLGVAGLIILGYMAVRAHSLALPRSTWLRTVIGSIIMFVGGNGFITIALKTIDSGVSAALVATTPLWMALLETARPGGERLTPRGWLGLILGLGGVLLLLAPKLSDPAAFLRDSAPLLVLGSSFCWALGSLVLRYGRQRVSHLAAAGWQLTIGGVGLTIIGVALGEMQELTPEHLTAEAAIAFVYLLVVGSLVGFVAYTWLLAHVSAAMAGTYAYVNPVVAILVGWLLAHEVINAWIIGGMAVVLAGVALVRTGGVVHRGTEPVETLVPTDASAADPPMPAPAPLRCSQADGDL